MDIIQKLDVWKRTIRDIRAIFAEVEKQVHITYIQLRSYENSCTASFSFTQNLFLMINLFRVTVTFVVGKFTGIDKFTKFWKLHILERQKISIQSCQRLRLSLFTG